MFGDSAQECMDVSGDIAVILSAWSQGCSGWTETWLELKINIGGDSHKES